MKTAKRFILSLSTLLLVSGVALAVPVSARDGISGHSNTTTPTTTNDSTTGTQTHTEVENHANDLTERFKAEARTDLAEKKTQFKEHTEAERQKSCEARKTALTNRMSNAVTRAKNHKAVFDKIFAKAKAFHDNKQLSTPNYDALVASADQAQADAAASISSLEALDVSVDCTSQTVATSVSAFQQAVKSTRDSLKTYRSAIVDLLKALKSSNSSSSDSSTNTQTTQ